MRKTLTGRSGRIYLRNNSSDKKHYFTVYSKEPVSLSTFEGTVDKETAKLDCNFPPEVIGHILSINTPEGVLIYNVNRLGLMDDGLDVTEVIIELQEKHGFNKIKIHTEDVLQ